MNKYFLNIYLSIYFSHQCRLGKNNFNSLHTIIMVAIPILASAILFCDILTFFPSYVTFLRRSLGELLFFHFLYLLFPHRAAVGLPTLCDAVCICKFHCEKERFCYENRQATILDNNVVTSPPPKSML